MDIRGQWLYTVIPPVHQYGNLEVVGSNPGSSSFPTFLHFIVVGP